MKQKNQTISFSDFIKYFPEIDLPVVIAEESIHNFSQLNRPLPVGSFPYFLTQSEEEPDEFTEFIPCLRFLVSDEVVVILIWKGELMSYEYSLISYQLRTGKEIQRKVIAGTKIIDQWIIKSSAVISADFEVDILVNSYQSEKQIYPERSEQFVVEVMPNGIMTAIHEK